MTKLSTLGGVVKVKKADGRVIHWDARDAVAFWSAKEYSGTGNLKNLARTDGLHDLVNNGAVFLPFDGEKYAYFPGLGSGNWISTPDAPELDITGDLDVRVFGVKTADWTNGLRSFIAKATGGGQDSFVFCLAATGALRLYISATGSGTMNYVEVPGGLTDGQIEAGLRATYRQSDRRVQFFRLVIADWVQVGTDQTHVATSIFAGTSPLEIGGRVAAAGQTFLGNIAGAEVRNGIDGTVVASWSAEDMAQTGGVSGGKTWTISRATSGLKTVLVDRPLFLLGTDDYLETPDHADFDFGAGDSFSVVTVFRQHHNPTTPGIGAYISKATSALRGWRLWQWHNDQAIYFTINDGTINAQDDQTPPALSTAAIRAGVRNTALDILKALVNGVSSGTTPDTTTDTLTNAKAVRIGSDPETTNYSDREFMGAAIFRRSLTDAEILEVGQTLGAD